MKKLLKLMLCLSFMLLSASTVMATKEIDASSQAGQTSSEIDTYVYGNFGMYLESSGANIRSGQWYGDNVKIRAPRGASLTDVKFLDERDSNGYQWVSACYSGVCGVAQYDPKVMYPTGSGDKISQVMRVEAVGSNIRTEPNKNAYILDTYKIGHHFYFESFNTYKDSEGYLWVKLKYNNNGNERDAYAQYDPAVMTVISNY